MKKLFISTLFFILFAACKNNKKDNSNNNTERTESTKKITKRDYSIQPTNSYSDLFLDSDLMENFIAEKKLNDTLTR